MSGLASFTFTRELLRVLVDFITVLTPSGRHIISIRSLNPLTYRRNRRLGGVSLSMMVLVGVSLQVLDSH